MATTGKEFIARKGLVVSQSAFVQGNISASFVHSTASWACFAVTALSSNTGSGIFDESLIASGAIEFTGSVNIYDNLGVNTRTPLFTTNDYAYSNTNTNVVHISGSNNARLISRGNTSSGIDLITMDATAACRWAQIYKTTTAISIDQLTTTGGTRTPLITALLTTQNVGIGNNSPAYKLDVSGSGNFTSDLTITGSITATGPVTASAISSSYVDLDLSTNGSIPYQEGRIFYDTEEGAVTVYNNEADISLQVGQEFWIRGYNNSGATILNGTPVRISGSQGDNPYIYPASSENMTSGSHLEGENHMIGLATHDIENATVGYVTEQGIVRGIDTSGFAAGDTLFLQTGSAGLRNDAPPFPYEKIFVGYVVRSHTNGFIFVKPEEPIHFEDISGLSGSAPETVGDLWVYQSNGSWTNTQTLSGSYTLNGDIVGTFSGSFSGSYEGNGSAITNITPSNIIGYTTFSSSIQSRVTTNEGNITNLQTDSGSFSTRVTNNESNISSLTSATGSYATTASNAFVGDQVITGSLTVTDIITAQEFHTEFVSSSIIYQSGSTQFGDSADDTHIFTGSVNISGSLSALTLSGDGSSLTDLTFANVIGLTSFSSSIEGRVSTNETDITNLQSDSGSFSTRITTNETNISSLQTASGSFSTRVTTNETNILNLQSDSGSFSTRITSNENSITGLQTDSGSFSTRITTNESNISNLQTDSGSFSTRVTSNESNITALQSDSGSFSTRVSTNETNISNLQTDSGSFSSRITSNETDISNLQSDSGSFSTRVTTNETNISNLQTDSGSFSTRVSQNETDISNLQTDSGSFSTRVSTNETNITNLQTDSGSFSTRVTTNETNISNLQTDSGSFSTRVSTNETNISSLQTASSSFSTRVSTNETGINNLQIDSGSFSTRVTDLENFSSSLDATYVSETELTAFSSSITTRVATNEVDISNLQSDSGSFSTRISTNETGISNLQTDSGSFSTRVTTNETNISNLQTDSGSFSTRVSANESNITDLQTASGSFSTRVTTNETDISNLQSDSGSFSTRVSQNETNISNLQTDSGSFSTRVSTNETNISNLQSDSGSFSTRVTTIEGSYATTGSNTFVGDQIVTGSLLVSSSINISEATIYQASTTLANSGSNQTITSFTTGSATSAFFDYTLAHGTNSRAGTITAVWNAANMEYAEVGTIDIGDTVNEEFNVDLTGATVTLQLTTTNTSVTVKTLVKRV